MRPSIVSKIASYWPQFVPAPGNIPKSLCDAGVTGPGFHLGSNVANLKRTKEKHV